MQYINYYRFCCRIRIADENADEVPGGEYLAVEYGDIHERREQFADARLNEFSDWFHETPALAAHVRALKGGHNPDVMSRLIDTEAAIAYTGREKQVLYRWHREGRISRYDLDSGLLKAQDGRRRVGWDFLELPSAGSPGWKPPPVRKPPEKNLEESS